ncbi:MAG: NHL repeat-containing protein [Thermoguttaceae bacterium]
MLKTVLRRFLPLLLLPLLAVGCEERADGRLKAVWGRRGISDGRFNKPRAMAIDRDDHLYIVDMTARIQVFATDGRFLRGWQTPDHKFGKPTGLSIARDGTVWVADTHYYRVLVYSPEGKLLKTFGGKQGERPGEFGLVTSVAHDSAGNFYVSEYGEYDRIQKFTPEGKFLLQWGGHGSKPGQFIRPQKMVFDEQDHLWVTDSCNHRLQVFDTNGKLLHVWGKEGSRPGQLCYPYDIALAGDSLYVCEYENHRVQKFTRDGRSLGCFGVQGRRDGQFFNPWALVRDSRGTIYVLDTGNNRVQVVKM